MSPNVRRIAAAAVLAAAFGILAGLVVAGELQWLDQYALDHWMPDFSPTAATGLDWRGLWRPFSVGTPWWQKVLALWTYPASFLVSALVVAGACVLLWRRQQARAAAIWLAAWLLGNGVEYLGKSALDRPRLHWTEDGVRTAIPSFQSSFPSGHTIRSLIVVALVVSLSRRARRPAIAWVVLVMVFLVVLAAHTPSDVLGGLCVGLTLVLAARAAVASRWARVRAPG